jgi:hypothetical protein
LAAHSSWKDFWSIRLPQVTVCSQFCQNLAPESGGAPSAAGAATTPVTAVVRRTLRARVIVHTPSQRLGFSTIMVPSCSSVIPPSFRVGITLSKRKVIDQSVAAPAL